MNVSYSDVWHGFPIPNVGLRQDTDHPCPGNGLTRSADGIVTPSWTNYPVVVCNNIPNNILEPAFDLRLELMIWRPKENKSSIDGLHKKRKAGWKHPTDFDAISSGVHGGADSHNGSQDNVVDPRKSEWVISQNNQVVAVNLSGYFRAKDVNYRDNAGAFNLVQALCPVTMVGVAGFNSKGGLKGINPRLTPLYIAFRYSMRDVDRGIGRVTGGLSKVIAASHKYSPLLLDPTFKYANGNKSGYLLNGSFDVTQMACRFARRNAVE